ncbi:MAG: ATP phosphoribosyltransferase [bacterium]|nr:ATP phosphoribosyltransferase [bacterium]
MNELRIVLPDGSMQEVVTNLLAKAGLPVIIGNKRTKEGKIAVDWISKVVFQRPQEIPLYLGGGHFDLAIVGKDWLDNWGYKFPVLLKLPIGRSGNTAVRIVLAVDETSRWKKVEDLPPGVEIATEYVGLVQKFFAKRNQNVRIVPSYGNTEYKIRFGADAIVDVTESGESLRENRLRIIHTIMESHTLVVANSDSWSNKATRFHIDSFTRFVKGAAQASQYVMLTANAPAKSIGRAIKIIGGLKGPTCSSLRGVKGWSALQSMVPRKDEQKIIVGLLKIGITDIVVTRDIPLVMS